MTSPELAHPEPELSEGMLSFLDHLRDDPTQPIDCIFGDGPAIIVRDMDAGCVALPHIRIQALCPQHDVNRTPLEGDVAVVDLSIDAAWSGHRQITPLFMIEEGTLVHLGE